MVVDTIVENSNSSKSFHIHMVGFEERNAHLGQYPKSKMERTWMVPPM